MADPKRQQKGGRNGNKNAIDFIDTIMAEKSKSREKYASDIPLQMNQTPAKAHRTGTSLRTKGNGTETPGNNTRPLPGDPTFNPKPQEIEARWSKDPEDAYFQDPEDAFFQDPKDAYFQEDNYQMSQKEADAAYYEYEKQQDEECKKYMLFNLKEEMWTIQKELKRLKNMPTWEKVDFFKDWLKSILETDKVEVAKKPAESTIAYLTETNAYLMRKLRDLESSSTTTQQPQPCDPGTQATPMVSNSCLTWASVAAKPAKPAQHPTPKTAKATQMRLAPQDPTADP